MNAATHNDEDMDAAIAAQGSKFETGLLKKAVWRRLFENGSLKQACVQKGCLKKAVWKSLLAKCCLKQVVWNRLFEEGCLKQAVWKTWCKRLFEKGCLNITLTLSLTRTLTLICTHNIRPCTIFKHHISQKKGTLQWSSDTILDDVWRACVRGLLGQLQITLLGAFFDGPPRPNTTFKLSDCRSDNRI